MQQAGTMRTHPDMYTEIVASWIVSGVYCLIMSSVYCLMLSSVYCLMLLSV